MPVSASSDTDRFKSLRDYALLADVAYRDKGEIEKALALQGYTLTTRGQLPGYEVSYYLATSDIDRKQVIAVRGTSNVENAMVDIALQLLPNDHTGIKLHQGFALSADYIFQKVR